MEIKLIPAQEKFLQSAKRFPCFIGGIGTGKTYMLLLKIWRFCETFPNTRALVVRREYTDLRDSTMSDFRKYFEVEVDVLGLSIIRQGAPEAARLFAETAASIHRREHAKVTGEGEHAKRERGAGRPTKRQLRDIRRFTGGDVG